MRVIHFWELYAKISFFCINVLILRTLNQVFLKFFIRKPSYGSSYDQCGVTLSRPLSLQIFQRLCSTNLIWSILEYFVPYLDNLSDAWWMTWLINCKKCRLWKDILEFANNANSFIYLWFKFTKIFFKI